MTADDGGRVPQLRALRMGIDTHEEHVAYMRSDCLVCRSEGFSASSRLLLSCGPRYAIATLNVVDRGDFPGDAIGLSSRLWTLLSPGDRGVRVRHAPVVPSLSQVRAKIYNRPLDRPALLAIIRDIGHGYYSDAQIAAFLTACAGGRLGNQEIIWLTQAMVDVGERLQWPGHDRIFDKHSIGGLPGNRTTPIVVAICAALGLVMPKTSSRAITSPAGTADTMEVFTEVTLDLERLGQVVKETGACLAWGGAVRLSPVDDVLIRVERTLDIDSEGQLVASVLSKKIAAGSTDVLIDIPVGPTAKVRTTDEAQRLVALFDDVAAFFDVRVRCVVSDGRYPVGSGIGPALEARDVLAVLSRDPGAPQDLRERALMLAAELIVLARGCDRATARDAAVAALDDGRALAVFERVCRAQGRYTLPARAPLARGLQAARSGRLVDFDNRKLARLAKLAGAPAAKTAGVELHVRPGVAFAAGEKLLTVHAETEGELAYALDYYSANGDMLRLEEE